MLNFKLFSLSNFIVDEFDIISSFPITPPEDKKLKLVDRLL